MALFNWERWLSGLKRWIANPLYELFVPRVRIPLFPFPFCWWLAIWFIFSISRTFLFFHSETYGIEKILRKVKIKQRKWKPFLFFTSGITSWIIRQEPEDEERNKKYNYGINEEFESKHYTISKIFFWNGKKRIDSLSHILFGYQELKAAFLEIEKKKFSLIHL